MSPSAVNNAEISQRRNYVLFSAKYPFNWLCFAFQPPGMLNLPPGCYYTDSPHIRSRSMQSRRNFIGKVASGLAGSLAVSNVLGANDRIRLGIIGAGDRG